MTKNHITLCFVLLVGCRVQVNDCTEIDPEKQEAFDKQITHCITNRPGDGRCVARVIEAYCKPKILTETADVRSSSTSAAASALPKRN